MLREVIYNDRYTAIIIVSLTIIVSAKLLNPNRFAYFMRLIGNSNYLRIHFKDHRFFDPFDVLLFINFCTNAVLTLMFICSYYKYLADLTHSDFIKLVIIMGLGLLAKILLELGIGYLFEIEKLSHSYVFQKISILNFLGVLLLPRTPCINKKIDDHTAKMGKTTALYKIMLDYISKCRSKFKT